MKIHYLLGGLSSVCDKFYILFHVWLAWRYAEQSSLTEQDDRLARAYS